MTRFRDVQHILDRVLGGVPKPNHGTFWRGVTRDQFVALEIFGVRMVVPGEPDRSGLLSVLSGRPPFALSGDDPGIRPHASRQDIETIRAWIAAGCPDAPGLEGLAVSPAGATVSDDAHVLYWRGVDFFFLPGLSSPETGTHVGRMHVRAFRPWHASRIEGQAGIWDAYMAQADVQESFRYIRLHQTRLIEAAYAASQDNLLNSFWKFGGNLLPLDPQTAIPPQRTMNSPYDWFFWAPYIDMSLQAADAGDADLRLARAWQVGIAADGLLRRRIPIAEFDATDPLVQQKVTDAFQAAAQADLSAGILTRAQAFTASPFFDGWPGV